MFKPLALSALFLAIAGLSVANSTDPLADSANWPFYARVLPEAADGLPPALTKYQGVLLRIEDDGRALIDFGRDGLHLLDPAGTDIPAQAADLQSGKAVKDIPNFARYTANIYFRKGPDGAYGPVPVDVFSKYAFCLIVYGDQRLVDEPSVKAWLDQLDVSARERGGIAVVLPTAHAFYARAAAERVDWAMVQPHMSIAFLPNLRHQPDPDAITVVAVDMEGRMLNRWQAGYDRSTGLFEETREWTVRQSPKPRQEPATETTALRTEAAAKAQADLDAFKVSPAKTAGAE